MRTRQEILSDYDRLAAQVREYETQWNDSIELSDLTNKIQTLAEQLSDALQEACHERMYFTVNGVVWKPGDPLRVAPRLCTFRINAVPQDEYWSDKHD